MQGGIFLKINFKRLIIALAIPLAVGGISAFLTMDAMKQYSKFNQPPLSPPIVLFPIVWTVLYILMGIGSYLVYESDCKAKESALSVYAVQLAVNFVWPFLFFELNAFLVAFLWLVLLWILVLVTIVRFYSCNKTAAYLQIPYILWLTFAGYLNFGVYLLN